MELIVTCEILYEIKTFIFEFMAQLKILKKIYFLWS
jgi:hypothetical protein